MKNLYIQCNMGAAGDMLMAALLELLDEPQKFIDEMNGAGIPKVKFGAEKTVKCGISGTYVRVTLDGEEEKLCDCVGDSSYSHFHENNNPTYTDESGNHAELNEYNHHVASNETHHHASLNEIYDIIDSLRISSKVKEDAKNVYTIIAKAESFVHQVEVCEIHFHEIGTFDAIADIVAVCALIEKLSPDKIICSSICVGNGNVKCAHGILPVPAPATAHILKNVPIYSGEINGELCTPTGAALLKYFVNEFGSMPTMQVEKVGYGMGKKDFAAANCVRVMLGETNNFCNNNISSQLGADKDYVVELCCNLDDMTGEAIAFAMECLLDAGALDVYTIPIGMKKNRPGIILCCLCHLSDKEKYLELIFKYTSTIGIRQFVCERAILSRSIEEVETEFGSVSIKKSSGYGVEKRKPEFEDIRKIAQSNNMSISEVFDAIMSSGK